MKVRPRKGGRETEAVQWFPTVTVEGVEMVPVTITFSQDGNRYRIEGDGVETTKWLETDGSREYGDAVWNVPPSNDHKPISTDDPLYRQFARAERWTSIAREYGRLRTGDRVHSSEWLVRTVLGAWTVYSPADFKLTFEVMA